MSTFFKKPKQLIFKQLSISISLAIASSVLVLPTHAADSSTAINYQIQQGSLTDALNAVAQRGNVSLLLDTAKTNTYQVEALSGQYTVDQALQALLSNTPFQIHKTPAGYIVQEAPAGAVQQNSTTNPVLAQANQTAENNNNITEQQEIQRIQQEAVQLAPLTVYGDKDRDTQGYDDVYDKNYSTVYAGKDLIERFKGTTPSDLFKGMSNVYSGDARNSGALDPNIRGMQGQGRVPVTIDGTEQSLTVWRGYGGANSRSYIDPNLISSIAVVKGASLDSEVKTGIAGGVAATTLQIDDIVRPGQKYGAEIKIEGATNSVKERVPTSYTGQDYRDVLDTLGMDSWSVTGFNDPLSMITPKSSDDNKLSNWDDKALRIAVGTKQEYFDLLAAYAYRSRGNYFAGKKGSDFYTTDDGTRRDISSSTGLVPYMATVYVPGGEVTNTSNWMESYLLKGTWRPTDDQALQLTYRDSTTIYGEIMPSRISLSDDGLLPQWPLSKVDTKAYSLEYKYNPEDNRWINLKLNLWQNDTVSETYTTGGFINYVKLDGIYTYCHPDTANLTATQVATYALLCRTYQARGYDRDLNNSYILKNTAYSYAENTRKGASLSNKFELLSNLGLTVGADLTREKLETTDEYVNDSTGAGAGYRSLPRAGRRSENQYWFNFDWQPTSWLSLTAGAKSTSYWSFDDYLNESTGGTSTIIKEIGKDLSYTVDVDNYTQEMYDTEYNYYTGMMEKYPGVSTYRSRRNELANKLGTSTTVTYHYNWYADPVTGKYSAENNPLLNGTIDISNENITTNVNGGPTMGYSSITETVTEQVKKEKDRTNWAPSFSAAFKLNQNNRFYINYSEAYRLPSLFETTLGFSASQSGYDLEPEHAHNWELAYVYNLKERLKLEKGQADIKLAYFRNKTENVIERNYILVFSNVDQQKIAGFELSGRYDNGKYFGDLSLVWNKQNQVCDETSVLLNSYNALGYTKAASNCVDYGFSAGYLINMALPEYQANLTLGTRLFDQKLELGTRITYFEGFKNPYIGVTNAAWFNAPLQWDDTWVVDAYANYKYNDHLSLDFVGTNLGNRYYLDPISRSAVPAPGRTFKLALTYTF
ncbi:TonB-dependent receptor [Acinetobacter puyangensis]|uniref:Hemoglobin/transferrin/lactoferrin receptor protein n=1 Tax=Acinetobacter puyangensis TaxID=1096779 RepID=A0A240E9N3_9GAMM|nr:TonB-dependent receptor [Acinetobacter puyangensis]SNX44625.1 hemoglobin/transferrin/lactoferrin receptor protein [Acinetobacter puyangensis]